MRYDRTVIGYHGCTAAVAQEILRGQPFRRSENDYDWLGHGVYFWEYGAHRAYRFAQEKIRRQGRRAKPAVIGAIIQLGRCFDLLDTRFTHDLAQAYEGFVRGFRLPVRHYPATRGLAGSSGASIVLCSTGTSARVMAAAAAIRRCALPSQRASRCIQTAPSSPKPTSS